MQDTAVEKIVTEFERLSFEQQTEVFRRLEEKLTGELSAKRSALAPRFVGHLKYDGKEIQFVAKVDPGAQRCLFSREI